MSTPDPVPSPPATDATPRSAADPQPGTSAHTNGSPARRPPVHVNGRWVEDADARVSVFDFGLQLGIGVFDTLRTYAGRVYRLRQHVARVLGSAAALRIPSPPDEPALIAAVRETVRRSGLPDARVRTTITPGRRGHAGDTPPEPTVIITAGPVENYPAELYARGMTVAVADFRQNDTDPAAGHKTLNYLPRMLTLDAARRKGAGEALVFNTRNLLACGCISNVFLVRADGAVVTPPASAGLLPGVTRRAVLDLAAAAGVKAEERDLTLRDVLDAAEVFLTNSVMEVMPVVGVEQHTVGSGRPGPVTMRLHSLYRAAVAAEAE